MGGTTVTLRGLGFTAMAPADEEVRSSLMRCKFGETVQSAPPASHTDTDVVCNTTWGPDGPQPVSLALNGVTFVSRLSASTSSDIASTHRGGSNRDPLPPEGLSCSVSLDICLVRSLSPSTARALLPPIPSFCTPPPLRQERAATLQIRGASRAHARRCLLRRIGLQALCAIRRAAHQPRRHERCDALPHRPGRCDRRTAAGDRGVGRRLLLARRLDAGRVAHRLERCCSRNDTRSPAWCAVADGLHVHEQWIGRQSVRLGARAHCELPLSVRPSHDGGGRAVYQADGHHPSAH
mmetsp:Transcript_18113/g.57878  ORF Transcript_18113/g.57878 Transcript_18113/m.57878 type:complete len:294 (-) Transcript_18113:817-1698(-)